MRRLFCLTIIFFILVVSFSSALSLTITQGANTHITTRLTDSYYGAPIRMNIQTDAGPPAYVYAELTQPLTNAEGFVIPDETLCWKYHYAPNSVTFLKGLKDLVPYYVGVQDAMMVVAPSSLATNIEIGTSLKYIPSVQANGVYTTRIIYTVVQ